MTGRIDERKLNAEIARLRDLSLPELRTVWQKHWPASMIVASVKFSETASDHWQYGSARRQSDRLGRTHMSHGSSACFVAMARSIRFTPTLLQLHRRCAICV
jgi:hypothetical protein